jgi:two-component system chemotaxis response regulator CheY
MARVLIVDDSAYLRSHLAKLLGERGYKTCCAENGEEAVELYRQVKPDVVLMDITMPKMNGMDALAHIRVIDPKARVIMLTALDQRLIAARAVHIGASDFLIKPVTTAGLLMAIQHALR